MTALSRATRRRGGAGGLRSARRGRVGLALGALVLAAATPREAAAQPPACPSGPLAQYLGLATGCIISGLHLPVLVPLTSGLDPGSVSVLPVSGTDALGSYVGFRFTPSAMRLQAADPGAPAPPPPLAIGMTVLGSDPATVWRGIGLGDVVGDAGGDPVGSWLTQAFAAFGPFAPDPVGATRLGTAPGQETCALLRGVFVDPLVPCTVPLGVDFSGRSGLSAAVFHALVAATGAPGDPPPVDPSSFVELETFEGRLYYEFFNPLEPGVTPGIPLLPSPWPPPPPDPGDPPPPPGMGIPFEFDDVPSGRWVDPPDTWGYEYEGLNGTLFTGIGLPNLPGQVGDFDVCWGDQFTDCAGVAGGSQHFFSQPLSAFRVTGIDPFTDSQDVQGFPSQLFFLNATGNDLTMTPLLAPTAVPEPATIALFASGASLLALLARRRRVAPR